MNDFRTLITRTWVQLVAFLLTNGHLKGFFTGRIFTGWTKHVCVPTLNCYSCPGALFACPVGAAQVILASGGGLDVSATHVLLGRLLTIASGIPFFVIGCLSLVGVLVGRATCGWLCPFGFLQDLVHRIPSRKFVGPAWLSYGKYLFLLITVILLPLLLVDDANYGETIFCEYLCPAGTLEGGLLLPLLNPNLRAMLGKLFLWKLSLLAGLVVLMVFFSRPFCRWMCPLGAFFGPFNRFSWLRLSVDAKNCTHCGACQRVCPTAVAMPEAVGGGDCLHCLECARKCPVGVIHFGKCHSKKLAEPVASLDSPDKSD